MTVTTLAGKEIDVTPWVEQMRENHRLKRNILEQTPIGTTADKGYFWWDEKKNPALAKRSVTKLIHTIQSESKPIT